MIGFVAGALVSQISLGFKIDGLREQLTVTQQQITPATPVPDTKSADGKPPKGKKGIEK